MREQFVFFNNGKSSVLYNIPTIEFYRVFTEDYIKMFDDYLNNGIPNSEAENRLRGISEELQSEKKAHYEEGNAEIQPQEFTINRLVFVLTTNCNLRCKYCYANHGIYHYDEHKNMSDEVILKAIEYFTTHFKSIKSVQFFGGEPALCEDKVELIINKFSELCQKGLINNIPKYGIVTNGTCLTDKLLKLVKDNGVSITFSIDGTPSIQNVLRPDSHGCGLSDKTYDSFMKAKAYGIKDIGIESTYTNLHIENNISIIDLIKFFQEHYNISLPHITPVGIDDDNPLSLKKNEQIYKRYLTEAIRHMLNSIIDDNKLETSVIIMGFLERILSKKTMAKTICPAGLNTISISPDGGIAPCFMFTSNNELTYGKIGDEPHEILKKAVKFEATVNSKDCKENCQNCFARSVCSSCLGYFSIKEAEQAEPISSIYCDILRCMVREILLQLAEIKSNPERWDKLKKHMQNNIAAYEQAEIVV